MPTEFRHIIFTQDETISAIVEYRRRMSNPLRPGHVTRYDLASEPDIRIDLEITPDTEQKRRRMVVPRDDLATALIMYCIDHRIPMPVKSTKFLQVFGGNVGLVITRNVSLAQITKVTQG